MKINETDYKFHFRMSAVKTLEQNTGMKMTEILMKVDGFKDN